MPAKQKILSILDRARSAMEEAYPPYEEPIYETGPVHYENYAYVQHGHSSASRAPRYDVHHDYEPDYRREYYREPPSYAGKPIPPHHQPPRKKSRHENDQTDPYYSYYYGY